MYLWVLIATFMVALLSYNLSVRPDADRAYMETKAQTIVAKFKAQHNAFRLYIDSLKIKQDEERETVDYVSDLGYNNGKLIYHHEEVSDSDLSASDVAKYQPFGYHPQSDVYSKVYCMVERDDEIQTCEEYYHDDTCCAFPEVTVYVVSWQSLPSRWVNKSDDDVYIPTSDMMSVISKIDGFGDRFGYADYQAQGKDDPVVSGGISDPGLGGIFYRYIFDYVDEHDTDYTTHCGAKSVCLVALDTVANREEKVDSNE